MAFVQMKKSELVPKLNMHWDDKEFSSRWCIRNLSM